MISTYHQNPCTLTSEESNHALQCQRPWQNQALGSILASWMHDIGEDTQVSMQYNIELIHS